MTMKEPINLREWRPVTTVPKRGCLLTCGRPGRGTFGRQKKLVADDIIDLWVQGLPKAEELHIVSLLGQKTTGFSEFGYYPFQSSKETGTKPTFQEWLNDRYPQQFVVHEFPTTDGQGIPPDVLKEVTRYLLDLIENGKSVLVIDSAGAERVARVCGKMRYKI